MTTNATRPTARERLLETADRLFYAEGIHTVGIDRILAESGVAKGSLYHSFGSKDGLVEAYLAGRHERHRARIERHMVGAETPRERILAVFSAQAELFVQPGYRGCAFAAATAEGPGSTPAEEQTRRYRDYVRGLFRDFARDGDVDDPDSLACQLFIVYDGAQQSAKLDPDRDVATSTRRLVSGLLDLNGL